MALPIIFANLPAGIQPLADFDTMFNNAANMSTIFCTAGGTANAIILTPTTNMPTVSAYANYQAFGFIATATSTGALTLTVGATGVLPVYYSDGGTRVTSGILTGAYYLVAYSSSLNSGGGGFQLIGATQGQFASPFTVSAPTGNAQANINNATAGQYAILDFQDAGVDKWQLRKDSSNNIGLYDAVGAKNYITGLPGGYLNLGPAQTCTLLQTGQFTVGTTTPTATAFMTVNGNGYTLAADLTINNGQTGLNFKNVSGTANYNGMLFNTNGGGTLVGSIGISATATAFNTTSDKRLKEDAQPLGDVGTIIEAITPVSYTWSFIEGKPSGVGFLAQDLALHIPEAVTNGDDGVADETGKVEAQWAVDMSKLVPYLVAELQSLRQRVKTLEEKGA